jgi:tetratricopeptide (TPR) repeat protein
MTLNFRRSGLVALTAAMLYFVPVAATAALPPPSAALQTELSGIQQEWARVNYQVTDAAQKTAQFEALEKRAEAFVKSNPGRAEPLIWQGIVLSTWAGAKGGLGALGLAKRARQPLEAALKIDPAALDGSAYTSLGTLYSKVPGFPAGFGDDDKAEELLKSALKLNPDGIDANYFFGEYLFDQDRYAEAVTFLANALAAPPRPNREVADQGRRAEATALLAKARAKLR